MSATVATYSPTQKPTAMGSWMKSAPTKSWWRNPRAIARYAYRWRPYHVSYDRRRRAARIELIATIANRPPLTSAIST